VARLTTLVTGERDEPRPSCRWRGFPTHRSLDPAEGLQDAQLDDGARVHIVHGDIARGGHVLVNIRKFTGIPFRSLGELVERDMLTATVAELLAACVRARLSIVFAGPPGSGKTTLLSCTTAELDPSLRVVVAGRAARTDTLALVGGLTLRADACLSAGRFTPGG
jgi:Flp pilus assembly CpaF family ATPase